VRYIALVVLAAVFLTGVVWWVVFLGNAILSLIRRR
jgi:cytoskeletal protein RodZ